MASRILNPERAAGFLLFGNGLKPGLPRGALAPGEGGRQEGEQTKV